jgi:cytoskeletal protein CcmA (bactofilin family)
LLTFTQVLQMSFMKKGSRPAPVAPPAGFSLLDSAATIIGDLDTSASLRIDGKMDGSVRRADVVVLGVGATMTGDIHAREVVIGGTLNGTVHAAERVELQATAIVTGDLVTQSVLVQEGGVVNGRVLMRPPESPIPASGSRGASSMSGQDANHSSAAKPAQR